MRRRMSPRSAPLDIRSEMCLNSYREHRVCAQSATLMRNDAMPKPRPKEATAPRQQRPTRENRGSNEGASAPFLISEGEKSTANPAKEANNGALQQADEPSGQTPGGG